MHNESSIGQMLFEQDTPIKFLQTSSGKTRLSLGSQPNLILTGKSIIEFINAP
jgi:hypothetical protein